ncbi:MAG: deoxyribodipyrimidine photo-lyase [Micrococcales bacterium]|nr:deoxyribodipyrimidine photo-lyase [Micrococcales bacterium]
MSAVYWFRRDLRLADNQALSAAVKSADGKVTACYFFNSASFEILEGIRQHSLTESIRSLDKSIGGNLNIFEAPSTNDIIVKLAEIAESAEANEVFAMRLFDPEGIRQQDVVAQGLAKRSITLKLVGSGYIVDPGTVRKPDGANYRVYTPFYKAWRPSSDISPIKLPKAEINWVKVDGALSIPEPTKPSPIKVIAGEAFAIRTLARFKKRALANYDEQRNRADLSGTSHLSHALAHGEIHPRTILAGLGDSPAEEVFRKEIAWREFYADVLYHYPNTLTDYYEPRFKKLRYDTGKLAEERFAAWCRGETGYPMVDAGMRQLVTEGWMHNRVRMIVASFLVKDLHIEWTWGAAFFEAHLSDFDPASNSHGWQWTAGCGTDASPYYRIFNPILQGLKFDPNGDYVRKYIPELRHLEGALAHEPWESFDGYQNGYPERIVDHNIERNESLARLEEIKEINK